jgi:hypothetical protein
MFIEIKVAFNSDTDEYERHWYAEVLKGIVWLGGRKCTIFDSSTE